MRPVLIASIVAVALPACTAGGDSWTVIRGDEVFAFQTPCARDFPPGLSSPWSPGAEDVAAFELRLEVALAHELARMSVPSRKLDAYVRQYAGFYRGGSKVIYVNAVAADAAPPGWKSTVTNLCDGGAASFGAVFDSGELVVTWIQFNGTI